MATQPIPYDTPYAPEVVDARTGKRSRSPYLSQEWIDWLLSQQRRVDQSPERIGSVTLTAQEAAISATPVPMPSLSTGLYRVSVYARITRAATSSSSLTVTISATDGGVTGCDQAGGAITGNTTATVQSLVFIVRADQATSITYRTAYSSSGATAMAYRLDIRVEAMPG